MKLFADGETLFRNEEVFDFSYMPEQINYRDHQLNALVHCLKPAMRGAKPLNALLIGMPATGKTTTVKLTFSELEEASSAVVVYVNCHLHPTPFRIFSEIHKKIFGHLPPETGIPLSSIYDKIFRKLKNKVLIVALDDMNYLQNNEKVLYDLLRSYESYPGIKTGIVAVSQKEETYKLSDRLRSIFQPEIIKFNPYTRSEITAILKQRAEIGLVNNAVSLHIIEKIAEMASEKNDLRFGIEFLKKAVMQAELDGSTTVKEEHLKKSIPYIATEKEINDNEKVLLELISKRMTSGELYNPFKRKTGASYSSFYRLLNSMEQKNMIKTSEKKTEKGGKTRVITKVNK